MRRVVWIGASVLILAVLAVGAWYVAVTRVETPDYTRVIVADPFELRRYPPMIAAETRRPGNRTDAVRSAFSPLARYIFARERGGPAIDMTAPVTQTPEKIAMTSPVTQTAGDAEWTVRFLMPAGSTLETLPPPAGDVTLRALPETTVAAVRFSGRWTDANFAEAESRLRTWMTTQGLVATGAPTFAYYNDPFTPFFLRRNEVMIDVEPETGG